MKTKLALYTFLKIAYGFAIHYIFIAAAISIGRSLIHHVPVDVWDLVTTLLGMLCFILEVRIYYLKLSFELERKKFVERLGPFKFPKEMQGLNIFFDGVPGNGKSFDDMLDPERCSNPNCTACNPNAKNWN